MISLFVLRLMPNVLGSPVSSTFTMLRIVSQHYLTWTSLSCPVNLYFSPGVLQLPSYWSLCFYDWPLECVLNPGVSMILIKQSVLCYFSAQTCHLSSHFAESRIQCSTGLEDRAYVIPSDRSVLSHPSPRFHTRGGTFSSSQSFDYSNYILAYSLLILWPGKLFLKSSVTLISFF